MIAGRSADLVRRWVELYTRGLAVEVRVRRREEIEADLWSQFEEATRIGRSERSTGGEVLVRLVAGMPADVSWRLAHISSDRVLSSADPATLSGARALGLVAIIGGMSIDSGLVLLAVTMEPSVWVAVFVGMIAMGTALAALVLRFQDRINGTIGLVGSIGSVGALLGALGPWTMTLLLPVGSAAVVWNLGLLGILRRRVASAHVLAAGAYFVLMALIVSGASPAVAFILLFPYPLTWVVIGASIIRDGPATEPAPAP
jgi:hypothetical protein